MGWRERWAKIAPKIISLSTSMEGTSPYVEEKSEAIASDDREQLRDIQDKEGKLARKAAATQLGLVVAPYVLPHALKIMVNPATAHTALGALTATGLDAAGLVGGLSSLNNYWNNRKNLTWNDIPGIVLSGLSLVPGSSQLTNPRNWAIAANTVKSINPAFRYRTLLERIKTNPELAPYYNDAASTKIKLTLKNDGNYNPDTHTVELPIFGNNRTIAHEMGHAGLRGGEMDIPKFDYDGTGLNAGNEAAADWFAGNLNERYIGKDPVMLARQNAVDNFDIIRHSFTDGTLHFGSPTTYRGVHQSSSPIREFKFPYNRWDVINHNADPNGVFFTLDKPAETGFLAKRPYTSYWEIKSQKPLIQTGEIRGPGNTKNNVRNAIVDYARRNGADAVEFRGIADNNLQNQNVLFATDKSGIRFKYESPITREISLVPQEGFTSLERVLSNEDLDRYNQLMKSFINIPPESINENVLNDLRKLESLSTAKIRTSVPGWGWKQIKLEEEFDKKLNNLTEFINKYQAKEIEKGVKTNKEIEKRVKTNFGWRPHSKSIQAIIDSDFTPFDEMKTLYQTGSKAKTTEDFRLSDYYKQGGIVKGQNGFLNTWQKAYNSKFGKGLRSFLNGADNNLTDEEYFKKHGFHKPVGNIGILGAVVAPEWELLDGPVVAENFGKVGEVLGVPKAAQMKYTKLKNFTGEPVVKSITEPKQISNWEKFLQKSAEEQDAIVKSWNDPNFTTFKSLNWDKKALNAFKKWLNR